MLVVMPFKVLTLTADDLLMLKSVRLFLIFGFFTESINNFYFAFCRHNLHHYIEFFKSIREALKTNTLDKFKKRIAEGTQVT